MDLKIHGAEPDAAERAAVDAVLGTPDGPRPGRDLLLPALHAVQSRFGWLPEGALNHLCRRLDLPPAEAHGVATFYHLFSTTPRPPVAIHVCDDIACRARGAESLCAGMEKALGPAGHPPKGKATTWMRSPCLGQCERAPAALAIRAGEAPRALTLAPFQGSADLARLDVEPEPSFEKLRESVPQAGDPSLRLLRRVGRVDPARLDAYRADGGYAALARALEIGPEGVIREALASKLAGRGGAAFPTGRKWEAVAKAAARTRYVVCNADESEPGTFKDRILMEGDPFAVVEGMTLAGFATGSGRGFLYIRGEYPLAARRMAAAVEAARGAGLLGKDILGAGLSFDIEIRRGAGAYICGEETALFNSIEGKRGEPRNKPPFPTQAGLFGKPTVVNNVETLVNVPWIVSGGGAAYAGVGTAGSSGTKLFCVSGHVARPGLYETSFGSTLRQVIGLAGGVPERRGIRAVLLGGAAGAFVGPDQLDIPLTFEGTRAAGASLGSGVVMVFDGRTDLGDILARVARFFRDESCGQCVPCRVGTVRQEELLSRLRAGRPLGSRGQELALLAELSQAMRDASICGLGHTASTAIESALASLDPFPQNGARK